MQYRKSHRTYEQMRAAGFLRLPSGRTLFDYSVYNKPASGWQADNLQEMKRQYDEHCQSTQVNGAGMLGGLFFDEVKIKEGLVYDIASGRLVGFVDDADGANDLALEELLATNVMQFYFKSLFTTFAFPCAYFMTRSVTSTQINRMFWDGVLALHDHGFEVMLACADGASYNRTFFRMNAGNQLWQCHNPFTREPTFFISDPPHLLKKLRNKLFNSGDEERHTRLMVHNDGPLLWNHIEAVRKADQQGPLRTTPLTKEHTNLDSLSKMKNRLAYDIFAQAVQTHMQEHSHAATTATRVYLQQCTTLMEVFQSNEPLRLPEDDRLKQLKEVKEWFVSWRDHVRITYLNKQVRAKRFVAWQTFEDLCMAVDGLSALIDHVVKLPFVAKYGGGFFVIPKRLSQDIVESYFSLQRSSCGGNMNMTGYVYGNNAQSIISSHVAAKNMTKRKTEMDADVVQKRKRTARTPGVPWPVLLNLD